MADCDSDMTAAQPAKSTAVGIVRNVTDQLTCPVCYQLYKNPRYLSCYHSYCEECLVKIQTETTITCPECRKVTKLHERGIKELQNNFFIARLVDELAFNKKVKENSPHCDQCVRDKPVEVFCFDCVLFLCGYCHGHHQYDKLCYNHNIIPLSEIPDDIVLQPKPSTLRCREHENELKYYCETCKELVCLYCTTKKHSTHKHDTINKLISKHRESLNKVFDPVDGMIGDLVKERQRINTMLEESEAQNQKTITLIDDYYENMYKKLQLQRDLLKKKLNDALQQSTKIFQTCLEQINCIQAQFESILELNNSLSDASSQEVLLVENEMITRMNELSEQYNVWRSKPVDPSDVRFVPNEDISFPQFGQVFAVSNCSPYNSEITNFPRYALVGGHIGFIVVVKDCHGYLCYSEGSDQIVVGVKSTRGEKISVPQLTDNHDGTYTGAFVVQQVGKVTASVTIKGHHVKGSPHEITVGKDYTTFSQVNKVVKLGHPWGIAFGKQGTWAFTDCTNSCVYVFSSDHLMRTFSGSGETKLYNPCGIVFDNDNHLYVADCYNHTVKKFDIYGNCLLHFSSDMQHFDNPLGIAIHDDKVYVTSNGCLMVFDTDGQFCHTIGSGILSTTPYDVVVSCNNCLLVADCGHNCVFTFTLDGKYIRKFGAQESEGTSNGQLKGPHGITVDNNSFVLVVDYNHCVSIFDQDGSYRGSFGSYGSGDGQLKYPHGIAVSPDGSVFVSDYSNKRILIFSSK